MSGDLTGLCLYIYKKSAIDKPNNQLKKLLLNFLFLTFALFPHSYVSKVRREVANLSERKTLTHPYTPSDICLSICHEL